EDESDLEVRYNGAALENAVDTSGFLTTSSNYTATGTVEFTAATTFTGSHTANGDELATMDDVDVKIAAQDFSGFVATTGAQSVAGVKTFTSPISGVDAVAVSDLVTLSQVNSASGNTTGLNVGSFAEVFKQKTGDDLEFRTIQSTDANIVITENTNDIELTFAGSLGVNDFIDLDDTPVAYATFANKLLAVNGAANAVEFIDAFGETFLDLTDTPVAFGTAGQVATVNGTTDALEFTTLPTQGALVFTDLTDVPNIYTSQANFFLRVNSSADGVSFDNLTIPETFLELTDTPSDYTGLENYTVVVNGTATALEFKEPPVNPVFDFLDLNDTPNTYLGATGQVPTVNGSEDALIFADVTGFDNTSLAAYVAAAGISLTGTSQSISATVGTALLTATGTGNAIVQTTGTGIAGFSSGSNSVNVTSSSFSILASAVPIIINGDSTTLNVADRLATNVQTSAMTGGTSDLYLATKKYVDDSGGFDNTSLAAYTAAAGIGLTTTSTNDILLDASGSGDVLLYSGTKEVSLLNSGNLNYKNITYMDWYSGATQVAQFSTLSAITLTAASTKSLVLTSINSSAYSELRAAGIARVISSSEDVELTSGAGKNVLLDKAPTVDLGAATKKYVDDNIPSFGDANTFIDIDTAANNITIAPDESNDSFIDFNSSTGFIECCFRDAMTLNFYDSTDTERGRIQTNTTEFQIAASSGIDIELASASDAEAKCQFQTSAMNSGSPTALAISTKGYVDDTHLRAIATYTVGTLPTVVEGAMIYVSDATGSLVTGSLCFGNATDWVDVTTGDEVA
ncbi:MAG: hypothetical protein GY795_21745, partial [Desulfobacterales bacterium]|nr:hypothetical protein [Desulfobacterales bacterium]